MLSSGLTLIFSMMGVLNFAHASFYMVGAYLAYTVTGLISARVPGDTGFTVALFLAPLLAGALGALFERTALRRVHKFGHVPELLITFGLTYVVGELVALVWGRSPLTFEPPTWLQGPAFTIVQSTSQGLSLMTGAAPAEICNATGAACSRFPMTRAFMAMVALGMLVSLWLLLTRTRIGLVIQAALTHPEMAESLGHNVPRVFMLVFGGGCALAGLAGVIGGVTFVTQPHMAKQSALHCEGRSIDLVTWPVEPARYPRLCALALTAGFDWVHNETDHCHASIRAKSLCEVCLGR